MRMPDTALDDRNKSVVNYSTIKANLVMAFQASDVSNDTANEIIERLDANVEGDIGNLVTDLDLIEEEA